MARRKAVPGVSRQQRLGDEGLERLQAHLERGGRMSDAVLAQWVRRYGDAARALLKQYGIYDPERHGRS